MRHTLLRTLLIASLLPVAVAHAQIPSGVTDVSAATPEAKKFFTSFFTAKSRHDVEATMKHFSPGLVTYTDVGFGWPMNGYAEVKKVCTEYMPKWPASALSYPTRILGNTKSAIVAFTDTPELFGGEMRLLGVVDFKDGKIVRWADYWDSTSLDTALYNQLRTPEDKFPTGLKESEITESASPVMRRTSQALQTAWASADAKAASELFSYDAVYEDLALRTQIAGRAAIARYLGRILAKVPYGAQSQLRHVAGSDSGGGFEWSGASSSQVRFGVTALELDAAGKIKRLTTVYDSRLLGKETRDALVALSSDPF